MGISTAAEDKPENALRLRSIDLQGEARAQEASGSPPMNPSCQCTPGENATEHGRSPGMGGFMSRT